MAIGDQAASESFLLVPNSGEDGKVKYGAREINRTRDYIAVVKKMIPATNAAARTRAGITYGSGAPSGGADGDIYFRFI